MWLVYDHGLFSMIYTGAANNSKNGLRWANSYRGNKSPVRRTGDPVQISQMRYMCGFK